eukprot:Clim_evm8s100 gene=Clim_evmTU8s100
MHFKIVALAAGTAVASAGSAPVNLPEIIRQTIASNPELFTSEAARQQFLEGDDPVETSTDIFIGKQTNFGSSECTVVNKVVNPAVACGVFTLDGENNEVVVEKDVSIGGTFTVGEQTPLELKYMQANFPYSWTWNKLGSLELSANDQSFSFSIGQEGQDPVLNVSNEWIDPLFVIQLPSHGWWNGNRLFWYRSAGGYVELEEDKYLWCGVLAEPKCVE